ncbi:MAG: valine--tRNA ligase, partial [Phycisphaerales bacterium JB039]
MATPASQVRKDRSERSEPRDPPTQYSPAETEARVWRRWESSGAMGADPRRVREGSARAYGIVIPPPNVTAKLHLGHALNNTLQDVLVRAHRMMGYETLWMPGTDHAGIATQTVVEKRLLETEGKRRTDYTREQFVARVQAWKDEFEQAITDQLRAMGCSCDYRRQRFTMDPVCVRAVREAFFRLFADGLIYRGKRLVNWDTVTQTALADDEVEMVEVDGHFYYLRYPLAHPWDHDDEPTPVTWSELAARGYPGAEAHPEEQQAWITVATTRPETYLGDTAVAVNPRDPRVRALSDFCVELPLVGRAIPIIADDYVVMADPESADPKARLATGFLKVTPAHDPNDYDIGLRHGLPIINVMAPDGSISDKHGWDDLDETSGAHVFLGKSREEARALVVREFEARGLLESVRPHHHTVGHSYRSHAPIEPYFTDQWYVRVTDDRLRGEAQRALRAEQRSSESLEAWPSSRPDPKAGDGELAFRPARYAKTYEAWHDNLRDWCISRQLWWGHRIPVWTATDQAPMDLLAGDESEALVARLAELAAAGRIAAQYAGEEAPKPGAPIDPGLPPTFVCVRDPEGADHGIVAQLESCGYRQDNDVLDTWFSSALWPLSTMGWPDPEQAASDTGIEDFPDLLAAFNPTDVLCTAREIITLWVSRMVMFNRFFLKQGERPGPAPFRDVFIHAMIQDGEGRKMSKTLGNGLDPLDIINSHGADAMRFTLCKMTTQTQDVRMPVERDPTSGRNTSPKFDEGRNFCNKIWNAARFALGILREAEDPIAGPIDPAALRLVDRWMLSRLRQSAGACEQAVREYQFSVYAQTLYDVFWRDFCDWYLEA